MRRAAVSVPANIAEGFKKRATDKARFMNIAQGSLEELRYYFILARDLAYVRDRVDEIGRGRSGQDAGCVRQDSEASHETLASS